MKRAPGEAAEAAVEVPMNRALGEAVVTEAEVDNRMRRSLGAAAVVAEAEVDDRMKIPLGEVAEEVVAHVKRVASGCVHAECVGLLVAVGVSSVSRALGDSDFSLFEIRHEL